MQFDLGKWAKVIFKKNSQVTSKNITIEINTEITDLEHFKTNKYLGINGWLVGWLDFLAYQLLLVI